MVDQLELTAITGACLPMWLTVTVSKMHREITLRGETEAGVLFHTPEHSKWMTVICSTLMRTWQAHKACANDEVFMKNFCFPSQFYYYTIRVICGDSVSGPVNGLDIRHHLWRRFELANPWLIIVHSVHRGRFVICVNSGSVRSVLW